MHPRDPYEGVIAAARVGFFGRDIHLNATHKSHRLTTALACWHFQGGGPDEENEKILLVFIVMMYSF